MISATLCVYFSYVTYVLVYSFPEVTLTVPLKLLKDMNIYLVW